MEKKKSKVFPIILILIGLGLLGTGAFRYFSGNKTNSNSSGSSKGGDELTAENVKITGHMSIGNDHTIYIEVDGEEKEFKYDGSNVELLTSLGDYSESIKVNITYVVNDGTNKLIKFTIFDQKTGDELKVDNVADLRTKLGLYNVGTYTEEFVLKETSDFPGFGINENEQSYAFYDLTFTKDSGEDLTLKYIVLESEEYNADLLVVGSRYKVTFKVEEDSFGDYECTITEITKI